MAFGLGKQLDRRLVTMDALAGEDMGANQLDQGLEHSRAGADVIGQRRERQVDAFLCILGTLPV